MKEKLRTQPFFIWLLPIFFIVHSYIEYIGFASFSELVPLLIKYLSGSTVWFLLMLWIYRNRVKAGIMTLYLSGIWFFFGAIFDFLKTNISIVFLSRWSFLLSVISIVAIVLFIYLLRTKKNFKQLVYYFNVLLLIFLAVDVGNAVFKSRNIQKELWKGTPNTVSGIFPDSCNKPDIYLLVFDAYSSNLGMQKFFEFDNSMLDSFLVNEGFQLLPGSRCNYNKTVLSMSSTLNMDYHYWFDSRKPMIHRDYIRSIGLVKDNEVMRVLIRNGYEIRNFSIFDLEHHPSPAHNYFKRISENILSDGTLGTRLIKTFHWKALGYPKLKWLAPFLFPENPDINNTRCYQATLKDAAIKSANPKFVYCHLLMPHPPYYYDKEGKPNPPALVRPIGEWEPGPDNLYTGYAQYANTVIENLVNTIQRHSNGGAVIIIMGDHGYNEAVASKADRQLSLYNLNAVYLPNQQYQQFNSLKDSISNVNQFRVLFNTLFDQQYPMLKDSFLLVTD